MYKILSCTPYILCFSAFCIFLSRVLFHYSSLFQGISSCKNWIFLSPPETTRAHGARCLPNSVVTWRMKAANSKKNIRKWRSKKSPSYDGESSKNSALWEVAAATWSAFQKSSISTFFFLFKNPTARCTRASKSPNARTPAKEVLERKPRTKNRNTWESKLLLSVAIITLLNRRRACLMPFIS